MPLEPLLLKIPLYQNVKPAQKALTPLNQVLVNVSYVQQELMKKKEHLATSVIVELILLLDPRANLTVLNVLKGQ